MSVAAEWESWLEAVRDEVNGRLNRYLAEMTPDCPPRLQEAMAYSLSAPGKRMRPVLVLMACEACGGERASAMPAACAIEMVHTYSLIHDDLPAMDDDDLRRGRPTCHREFDEATAILAGDALLTLAFEVIAGEVVPSSVAAACVLDLASAAGAEGMVGGQAADLEAETSGVASGEALEGIHRRKTGRLLCSAVTLGARIAGASEEQIAALRTYGESIGLAFQIADDLLDVEGDVRKMGKGVRKDATHNKLTYPALWGVEESRRRAESLVEQACVSLQMFGARGQRLEALARFIIARDH
jgi:geranylgeranyl diphosphate synthase type II